MDAGRRAVDCAGHLPSAVPPPLRADPLPMLRQDQDWIRSDRRLVAPTAMPFDLAFFSTTPEKSSDYLSLY